MAPDGPRPLCKEIFRKQRRARAAALPSTTKGDLMSLRDAMRDSAAPHLGPGEPVQAVIGAQTAGQETLRVHRRFFKDLEAADGMVTASAGRDNA
jgi:hypothetical protein